MSRSLFLQFALPLLQIIVLEIVDFEIQIAVAAVDLDLLSH